MAPERSPKRQKTSGHDPKPTQASHISNVSEQPHTEISNDASSTNATAGEPHRASWYNSLRRKAPPLTSVVRESIKSINSTTTGAVESAPTSPRAKAVRSPSLAMTLGKANSNRALPADATTTVVHAVPETRASNPKTSSKKPEGPKSESAELSATQSQTEQEEHRETLKDDLNESEALHAKPEATSNINDSVPASRSSWLGWMSKIDATQPLPSDSQTNDSSVDLQSEQQKQRSTEPTISIKSDGLTAPLKKKEDETHVKTIETQNNALQSARPNRRSWLFWGIEEEESKSGTEMHKNDSARSESMNVRDVREPQNSSKTSSIEISQPPSLPHDASKASAWAFWSRDRGANDSTASIDKPREGEIAVSDTPSQGKPKRASLSLPEAERKKQIDIIKSDPKSTAASSQQSEASDLKPHTKSKAPAVKAESSHAKATAQEPVVDKKPASIRSAKTYENLLLPELQATLKLPEQPSFIQQFARLLRFTEEPEMKHLSLIKEPPKIRNALAIGVHGYFPAPLIRTVLGQPTGTSMKFADMAAKSIKRWTKSYGYECKVKTAALEGEGKIAERLELLWKLLLNWVDEIQKSDFVLVACHSQGVPVAIMLVAKLIQFGCVNASRIGVCAMAGVNMGPFTDYKSRWISGSAGELFEFSDPDSRVSSDYLASLKTILEVGVHVTFVGSIDDQLVSLESSIFSPISHPHIYRAVSIDARVHAPDFLSHLVGFALKLRNLGVQDHGLIKELSPPLAGSLYTGEGHSRIYEDDAVYDLAVAFALETNSLAGITVSQRSAAAGGTNPYILPFAMRGMLEEDFVKNQLHAEASTLLKQFDDWKPTTKVMKDVKFRLEGIRSRL